MKYFHWRITLIFFLLFSSLVIASNRLEVGYNYDESKNIDGYSKELNNYDFDNDGKNEKVITFFKISKLQY